MRTICCWLLALTGAAHGQAPAPNWTPKPPAATADAAKKLVHDRHAALAEALRLEIKAIEAGQWTVERYAVFQHLLRALTAVREELAAEGPDRRAALAELVEDATDLVGILEKREAAGTLKTADVWAARADAALMKLHMVNAGGTVTATPAAAAAPKAAGWLPKPLAATADVATKLRYDRHTALAACAHFTAALVGSGQWNPESLPDFQRLDRDLLAVREEIAADAADRAAAAADVLAGAKKIEVIMQKRFEAGQAKEVSVLSAKAARLGIEARVAHTKGAAAEERKLLGERRTALDTAVKRLEIVIESGQWDAAVLNAKYRYAREAVAVAEQLAAGKAERVAALESLLTGAKKAEALYTWRAETGTGKLVDVAIARAERLEVEIRLLRAK